MANRERKRSDRQRRKQRAAERASTAPDPYADVAEAEAPAEQRVAAQVPQGQAESFSDRMAKRSEMRNAEARAALEPLDEGERPGAVTVGAIVVGIFAVIFTVSAVLAATGSVHISGSKPKPVPVAVFGGVLWLMVYGLWKARYWAVLGLQMLLVLVLAASGLGLLQVTTIVELMANLSLLGGAGTLFYFLIRAMARIQMPERPQ